MVITLHSTDDLLDDMDLLKMPSANNNGAPTKAPAARTPHSFLGENSALVNLDNLIKPMPSAMSAAPAGGFATANPFSDRPNFFAPQPVSEIFWIVILSAFAEPKNSFCRFRPLTN